MVGQGVGCLSLELGHFTISVEDVLCMLLMASTSLRSRYQTAVSLVVVAKRKVPMSEGHKDKQYPHNTQEALTHPELFCREISHSFSNSSEVLGSGDYRQPVLVIHPILKVLVLKQRSSLGYSTDTFIKAPRVARERLYKLTVLPRLDCCKVFGIPTKQSTRKN